MSKRIAISCPDHVYKLLGGLSDIQGRPMSKIIVELLEAAYPALDQTYMTMLRLSAQKARVGDSMASEVGEIMNELSTALDAVIDEAQLELAGLQPPYGNTGATLSQIPPKTPKLRGV